MDKNNTVETDSRALRRRHRQPSSHVPDTEDQSQVSVLLEASSFAVDNFYYGSPQSRSRDRRLNLQAQTEKKKEKGDGREE